MTACEAIVKKILDVVNDGAPGKVILSKEAGGNSIRLEVPGRDPVCCGSKDGSWEDLVRGVHASLGADPATSAGFGEALFRKSIWELQKEIVRLEEEVKEFEFLFELQHKRTKEADAMWQEANNKPGVLPDLGKLIEWLMERKKRQEVA